MIIKIGSYLHRYMQWLMKMMKGTDMPKRSYSNDDETGKLCNRNGFMRMNFPLIQHAPISPPFFSLSRVANTTSSLIGNTIN